MKFPALFFFALYALLSPAACSSQSSSPQQTTRSNAVVPVYDLPLPRKAAHAFEKGVALLLKGDAQASLPYFQAAADLAPFSYRPYHNMGLAHYRLGQYDAAAADFQKSIDLTNGNFAPSMFALSMILYQRSQFAQAETLIRNALLLAPASGVGKYCLGLVQYALGRLPEADLSAHEALALDPTEADAHVLLARIHTRQHNPSAALAEAQAYLKLEPHGPLQPYALSLLQRAQQDLAPQSASLSTSPQP
jgi:tetratricopeptide (TPR) repeat protein